MKEITYYSALTYGDCEGRSTNVLGNFTTYEEAFKRADGKDGFGRTIKPRKHTIVIYDTVEESLQDQLVKSVDKKNLTREEIEYIKKNM